jgi:glycosyltransferase involved in cell wall biosynthesis
VTRPKKGRDVKRIPLLLATHLLDTGGSERQVRQTAVALDRSRFDVHLAFFRPDPDREREMQAAGVKTVYVPLFSYASLGAVRSALRLRRYLKDHGIQLVHAFDNPSSTFAAPVARLSGTAVVLASQRSNRFLEPKNFQRLRHLADPFAHGFVVNAQTLFDHLVKDEGVAPERIRICPNGLDTKRFTAEGRKRILELEDATLVIGCIATHRPEKQLPFLVDAFAEMRRLRPGLKLVLVGSGTETAKIVARVEAGSLGADCLMIPHTPDTAGLLRSIDIFVLTSSTEGASNSVMEAMASGCAVVASNVEGTRDLVRDGSNGFLFEFGNQGDLVAKVLALVDDAALRQRVAADSSEWVRANMSVEASVARMTAIYDEYLVEKGVIKG